MKSTHPFDQILEWGFNEMKAWLAEIVRWPQQTKEEFYADNEEHVDDYFFTHAHPEDNMKNLPDQKTIQQFSDKTIKKIMLKMYTWYIEQDDIYLKCRLK